MASTDPIHLQMVSIHPVNSITSIQINEKDARELIQAMIERQIPFTVQHTPVPSNKDSMEYPLSDSNDVQLSTIEIIYKKYIIGGLERLIPNMEEIAKEFAINTSTFKVKFRERYGKTFYQVYLEKKMEHAAMLLEQGLKANVVSDRIGYSHPIKFNKMFQKHFGITPKKYQTLRT